MDKPYSDFTIRVIEIIKNIPRGQVMTYGEVAKMAGNPSGTRQVVRILHSLSDKHNLPWHRVVNKASKVALKGTLGELQRTLLEEEAHSEDSAPEDSKTQK